MTSLRLLALFAVPFLLLAGCEQHSSSPVAVSPPPPVANRAEPASPAADAKPTAHVPAAKAVAPVTEFDFGFHAPGETGSHEFILKNEGDAPLTLREGPTSCVCTFSDVEDDTIPPGGSGKVKLQWKAETQRVGPFGQTATIFTNDPQRKAIEFYIFGKVFADAAAEPSEVSFESFGRGEARHVDVAIYTQLWSGLTIEEVVCDLGAIKCELLGPSTQSLDRPQVQGQQTLRVTVPESMPRGDFAGTVRMTARGTYRGAEVRKEIRIPLSGRARVGLTISGPKWNKSGLEIGLLRQGQGFSTPFIIKAFGVQEIDVAEVHVEPSWVRVKIEPVLVEGKPVGLYRVHVTIPEDAPICDHMTPRCGEVRIKLRSPEVRDVVAKLEFCVTE